MALTKFILLSALFACAFAYAPRTNNLAFLNSSSLDIGKVLHPLLHTKDFLKLSKAEQVAIVNDYSEVLFLEVNAYIAASGLDPLPLDDLIADFQWTIFFGEASLKNGDLKGIGTIIRSGDVTVRYEFPVLTLGLPLSFSKLELEYDYLIQFMGLGPSGVLTGKVQGCKYTIDIDLDLTTLRTKLGKFNLDTLGKINLELHGGIIEGMLSFFINLWLPLLEPIIRLVLDGFLEPAISGLVDMVNSLIEQLLGKPDAFCSLC